MTNNPPKQDENPANEIRQIAKKARNQIRKGMKATLATLHHDTGYPYASLVTTATDFDNSPILLISDLALHTQNILINNRASLLFDGTGGENNPLEGSRLSVWGKVARTEEKNTKTRFLARHPDASVYASFSDFSFFKMKIEAAHFVAGFGKIADLSSEELILNIADSAALRDAEPDIVEHMNEDHLDAIQLYATRLLGTHDDNWSMTGCDTEGCDLKAGCHTLRLEFPRRANTPDEIRQILIELVNEARTLG